MSGLRRQHVLPVTTDTDTGGYWQAATEERLALCACRACGMTLHLPKGYCHHCGSWDVVWRSAGTTGTLYSWTVVRHSIHSAFPAPCTVILVALDDDPTVRLVGNLQGEPPVYAGMPMQVWFEHVAPGVTLPQWQPVEIGRRDAASEMAPN